MQLNYKSYTILILVSILAFSIMSCKKFVDTETPATQIDGINAFENETTAAAVLTGIYSNMSQGIPYPGIATGTSSFSLLCGLSADEYSLFTGAPVDMYAFYSNSLIANSSSNFGTGYWSGLYEYIYVANNAIEGLIASNKLPESVKSQLIGEAKFIRAFCYFYLVNLYGDAAIVTSTDYSKNRLLARSPSNNVYALIKEDLLDAAEMLNADYLDGKLQKYTGQEERVRPTKWAAKSLLARVYLYTNDYVNAENASTVVINNTTLYDTVHLNDVFLKNSKEAIWQLQPIRPGNTDDSRMFILSNGFSSETPVWLSDTLMNSFETGDLRVVNGNWVNSATISGDTYYYPYKYKDNSNNVTEYVMVMRLAEQYLIRAEARAKQNKISEAKADLNVIRLRAGLPNTSASDEGSLVDAIIHERQTELFSEWGHRWLDLKRTNRVDAVMSVITPLKSNGSVWQSHQKLYPLSFRELQTGINLTQNPGY